MVINNTWFLVFLEWFTRLHKFLGLKETDWNPRGQYWFYLKDDYILLPPSHIKINFFYNYTHTEYID